MSEDNDQASPNYKARSRRKIYQRRSSSSLCFIILFTFENLFVIIKKREILVIVNGNAPASIASVSGGAEAALPPKRTEQKIARRNELNVKSTLLLAIPDEHLLKFHGIKDAKTLWEAIKTRFEGNKESKKMQKTILKQQYENFAASRSKGLDKTYDMFQKLISQLEIHGNKSDLDTLSIDDLYNNLKIILAVLMKQLILLMMFLLLVHMDKVLPQPMLMIQLNKRDLNNKSDMFESTSDSSMNESEEDNNKATDRYKEGEGYHAVPPPYTGNFMPPRPDLSLVGLDDYVFKSARSETVTSVHETEISTSKTSKESMEKPKSVRPSAPIIED
nr:ribonuclease H-like domain-containing protein [Tanacetum cinerariifolium]